MKRITICLALFLPLILNAQTQLTLKSAIDTALKNNLDIQIAKNYVEIAKVSNNFGNAGGLPFINANAGDNLSMNTYKQEYSEGPSSSESNVMGNNINAGISANIVLFNGFRVLATKKRLSLLQQQSEIVLNGQVQDIIAAVMIEYYSILRLQSNLTIMQSILEVAQQKLSIINEKDKVGMASAVDIMQAQSDLNTAQQDVVVQKALIDNQKSNLLMLINARQKNTFVISDSIIIDNSLVLDSVMHYLSRNPQLISAEHQVRISQQMQKETAAQRYPSLKFNTAYNFIRTDYDKGYTLLNQNYGPTAGLTLQVPIFNSNIYRTQKIVAGLNIDNAKLEKENLYNSLATTVNNKYNNYSTTLQQIASQRTNFKLAKDLVDLVMQKFQYGQATILDVKAAQASYEDAAYQLINFLYVGKKAEIELKQLIYQLEY